MSLRELETSLLKLSKHDDWTLADACEGTIIFGGNGSGKTSGSGRSLAQAFLAQGYGGLILTAKVDEARNWIGYAERAGRTSDVILVEPNGPYRLNFLDYEAKRPGRGAGLTCELVRLLQMAMNGGRHRGQSNDPYWDEAGAELLTNAIDIAQLADDKLSLSRIVDIMRTAPLSIADAETMSCSDSERFAQLIKETGRNWGTDSLCAQAMRRAEDRVVDPERRGDLRESFAYFLKQFASLAPQTRGSILACLMARLTGLLRSPFRTLFSTDTTVTPEDSFAGKLIILNLPIKEYGDAGRFAQVLFKTVWQRSVERRGSSGVPVFLWADEAQYFVTEFDMLFQQTARSSRAATVYLTQSIVNFRAALDSDQSEAISEALLGNLQTKIFHANACPTTNEYAERLFGKELKYTTTAGVDSDRKANVSLSQTYLPILPGIKFTTLRKGGFANGKQVDAYLFQAGKLWNGDAGTGKANWLLVNFHQECPVPSPVPSTWCSSIPTR